MAEIGERVTLWHLLHKGDYPGTIIDVDILRDTCTVKLDCQEKPVVQVLYYDSPPDIINSNLWQVCFPEDI